VTSRTTSSGISRTRDSSLGKLAKRWRIRFDAWIFRSYNLQPRQLGLCRILYALFNLIFLFDFHFDWLGDLPSGFFAPPPGLAEIIGGFPSVVGLRVAAGVLMVLNILLLLGWRSRLVSVAYSLLLMSLFSLVFSLGNIYHIVLWMVTPLLMGLAGWGNSLSLDAVRAGRDMRVATWPVTLLALLTGFAFFTAGFAKLTGGWLNPEGSATWQHFIRVYFAVGRDRLLAPAFVHIQSPAFWELADWFTVWWELGFLLAVLRAWSMRLFCWLGVFFHVAVLLILNISFSVHLVVFLVFIDWERLERLFPRLFAFVYSGTERVLSRIPWWVVVACTIGYLFAYFQVRDYSRVDMPRAFEFVVFAAAVAYCLASPCLSPRGWLRRPGLEGSGP
jgi:uncharacterized membrane protein YphA (DoxX/SURF4 family)